MDEPETKTLVELAEAHELPLFQYMDVGTQQWILSHDPNYGLSALNPTLEATYHDISATFALLSDWFLEPKIIDSIHGKRHLLRTTFMAFLLAQPLGLPDEQIRNVIIAGLLHDIRRQDDKGDTGHADRSAQWFMKQVQTLEKQWHIAISARDQETIAAAIALHETPYTDFSEIQKTQYQTYRTAVDIVKTADALDRYRLPKLKWWPSDSFLSLVPIPGIKQFAFNLVVTSEGFFLHGCSNEESVSRAIHHCLQATAIPWSAAHTHYADEATS